MNTFFTQASLTVLYLLCESNIPLTIEQISNALSEVSEFTYIDVVIGLENLSDNEYVSKEAKMTGDAYLPTIEGRITLSRLTSSIHGSVRKKLLEYIKNNFHMLTLEANVYTRIVQTETGKSEVMLRSYDKDMETNDIILTVSDSQQAHHIAENWKKHADEAISKLYEVLLADDK